MTAASASKGDIVEQLFTVFRDRGFDGASLADLSRATGLGKSSLYHHFPNGKEQMAQVVLSRAEAYIDTTVFQIATGPEPLKLRVHKIVAAMEQLYDGGRTLCVLGQLATSRIGVAARQTLQQSFEHWTTALTKLARDAGMTPSRAKDFAEDWIAQLQGALLLHAATGSLGPFHRALKALSQLANEEA